MTISGDSDLANNANRRLSDAHKHIDNEQSKDAINQTSTKREPDISVQTTVSSYENDPNNTSKIKLSKNPGQDPTNTNSGNPLLRAPDPAMVAAAQKSASAIIEDSPATMTLGKMVDIATSKGIPEKAKLDLQAQMDGSKKITPPVLSIMLAMKSVTKYLQLVKKAKHEQLEKNGTIAKKFNEFQQETTKTLHTKLKAKLDLAKKEADKAEKTRLEEAESSACDRLGALIGSIVGAVLSIVLTAVSYAATIVTGGLASPLAVLATSMTTAVITLFASLAAVGIASADIHLEGGFSEKISKGFNAMLEAFVDAFAGIGLFFEELGCNPPDLSQANFEKFKEKHEDNLRIAAVIFVAVAVVVATIAAAVCGGASAAQTMAKTMIDAAKTVVPTVVKVSASLGKFVVPMIMSAAVGTLFTSPSMGAMAKGLKDAGVESELIQNLMIAFTVLTIVIGIVAGSAKANPKAAKNIALGILKGLKKPGQMISQGAKGVASAAKEAGRSLKGAGRTLKELGRSAKSAGKSIGTKATAAGSKIATVASKAKNVASRALTKAKNFIGNVKKGVGKAIKKLNKKSIKNLFNKLKLELDSIQESVKNTTNIKKALGESLVKLLEATGKGGLKTGKEALKVINKFINAIKKLIGVPADVTIANFIKVSVSKDWAGLAELTTELIQYLDDVSTVVVSAFKNASAGRQAEYLEDIAKIIEEGGHIDSITFTLRNILDNMGEFKQSLIKGNQAIADEANLITKLIKDITLGQQKALGQIYNG